MVHIYLRVHVGDFLLKPANPFFIRDLLVSVPLNEGLFGLFDLIRALFEPLVLLLGVEQFGQPYETSIQALLDFIQNGINLLRLFLV